VVTTEDARSLLGGDSVTLYHRISIMTLTFRSTKATAYIFADLFDEFQYNHHNAEGANTPAAKEEEEEETKTSAFVIPLTVLLECLNIFGSAGPGGSTQVSSYRKWKGGRAGEGDVETNGRQRRTIDSVFGSTSERKTSMRMSWGGIGYPLTLFLYVLFFYLSPR
jgi:cell cycle checkpoint protein